MAIPSTRWFHRIGIAITIFVSVGALLWAVWWLWSRLAPQWDPRTIMAIVIVAVPPLVAVWWLWWWLPGRQVAGLSLKIRDPKARADTEDNFRKTVGQALGGASVLIGAVVAYLQFTQQQQASHDLLISNQVAKSFEQLGSTETAMRLGGIYGLEGVMNTSPQYHQPVLEALCAFVRDSTRRSVEEKRIGTAKAAEPVPERAASEQKPATDVQAALTVIGRRNPGPGRVDLRGANIPGADLHDAHLEDANLYGAHLEHAWLWGAHLERINLRDAHLESALLNRAYLEGALLDGAHFEHALLWGTHLSDDVTQAQIEQTYGDAATILPSGLTRPAGWLAVAAPGGGVPANPQSAHLP